VAKTTLALVLDPGDAVEDAELLQRLHSPRDGRIVVEATPGGTTRRAAGHDLLRALGRDPNAVGGDRNGTETWVRATVWCIAEGVREIIVSRAHLFSGSLLDDLVGLAYAAQARLWLVAQAPDLKRSQQDALACWPIQQLSVAEFREQWKPAAARPKRGAAARANKAAAPVTPYPQVPLDDFTSFLAACHDLLPPADFAHVHRAWTESKEATARWLEQTEDIDEVGVEGWMRALLGHGATVPELLTRARGAQVGFFLAGWYLRVDIDLLARVQDGPRVGLEDWVCEVLRAYTQPRLAAAAVLSLGFGLSSEEIVAVDLEDLAQDGSQVAVRGTVEKVPAKAMGLLLALALERRLAGAEPGDPLFVHLPSTGATRGAPVRWKAHGARLMIKQVERESGLPLTAHWESSRRPDDSTWARRRGVLVEKL